MVSNHYKTQREKRERFISKHFHSDGYIIDGFIVDKGHKNGAEVHSLTDNGLIIIHNLESGALVTKLIAREKQIKRYYKNPNREKPPEYEGLLALARLNRSLGYNNM